MKCSFCESVGKVSKTDVINSRQGKGGKEVWRRRQCLSCKGIFTTTECFSYGNIFVVKRNLIRKRFVYEKLFTSIVDAVTGGKGSDRGDEAVLAKEVVQKVLKKLLSFESNYISSKDIIRATYEVLVTKNQFFAMRYMTYSDFRLQTLSVSKKLGEAVQ
jgi:transcriptional repressor NrdR